MTDSEKIQKIVEFMGGWTEHQIVCGVCIRCDQHITTLPTYTKCRYFNPFTRIEDAFLVVERLREKSLHPSDLPEPRFSFSLNCVEFGTWESQVEIPGTTGEAYDLNPARAITESAWQVIEKLNEG